MPENVNFLAQQQQLLEKRDQNDKRSFAFVFVLIAIAAIVYAVLWFIDYRSTSQIQEVEQQIDQIRRTITQNNAKEKEYLIFYEKLTKLDELIAKRTHGTQALVDTYDYFLTENTSVSSSIYDYYTTNIELDLVCNSVFSLPTLFELVQAPEFTSQYQSVELVSLMRNSDDAYRLKIILEL